jgi:hypothetical protein
MLVLHSTLPNTKRRGSFFINNLPALKLEITEVTQWLMSYEQSLMSYEQSLMSYEQSLMSYEQQKTMT